MYSTEVKRWVKSGQQLLDASTKELEKELGIKVRHQMIKSRNLPY